MILKIIASPFMFSLILISYNYAAIKKLIQFIKYGGDLSIYEKDDKVTMMDIYKELKKQKQL